MEPTAQVVTGAVPPVGLVVAASSGAAGVGGAGGHWCGGGGCLAREGAAAWSLGVLWVGRGLGLGPREQGSLAWFSDTHLSGQMQ